MTKVQGWSACVTADNNGRFPNGSRCLIGGPFPNKTLASDWASAIDDSSLMWLVCDPVPSEDIIGCDRELMVPMETSPSIDITKEYKTRDGKRVINLARVDFNSAGHRVTYPIKGTIIVREKPRKTEYAIWSDEGVSDVVWGNHKHRDLVPA